MRPMRWLIALFSVLLASGVARSQIAGVEVELVLDESNYLPGEELPVGVRISNLSGRPITFGSVSNWLTFHVENKRGEMVERYADVPVEGEFTLESAKAGTKWWNIQPYFGLDKPGRYVVYAELRLPEWEERLLSEGTVFTIQSARNLWEMSFGVPPANGDKDAVPEIRRYSLQAATRQGDTKLSERRLYARVTDDTQTRIYRVVLLDRFLSFSNPEQQIDSRSRLHVLFQTAGSAYTYSVIDPDGRLLVRQRHEITPGSRPYLAKSDAGSIAVRGGRRIPTMADIPPYEGPLPSAVVNTNLVTTNLLNTPVTKKKKPSRSERRRQKEAQPQSP